jgi:signal transduction histidine kinase
MQVHRKRSDEAAVKALQHQIDELTAENLLLQDQLTRKEQFIAMIAHELRGPLSPIINYAQMIARQVNMPANDSKVRGRSPAEVLQRQTSIIISQARRMTRLVNDLLDASRLTSGQFTLIRSECDLIELSKEVVEQLYPVAPYHTFKLDMPDSPIKGNWDAGRLQQALGNLLDNAIKYSDEGTTITVKIWTEGTRVHVSVHNQGTSIPSRESEHLFRPFARLQATSGVREGSGLGLYITKSIIEAHEGELHLEPISDNVEEATASRQGTTFSFDLPLENL